MLKLSRPVPTSPSCGSLRFLLLAATALALGAPACKEKEKGKAAVSHARAERRERPQPEAAAPVTVPSAADPMRKRTMDEIWQEVYVKEKGKYDARNVEQIFDWGKGSLKDKALNKELKFNLQDAAKVCQA